MKIRAVVLASLLALGSDSLFAEPMRLAQRAPGDAMSPVQIVGLLRARGYSPIARPMGRGPAYAVRAIDSRGRLVRVIVDARAGEILSVQPSGAGRGPRPPRPVYPGVYGATPPDANPEGSPGRPVVRPPAAVGRGHPRAAPPAAASAPTTTPGAPAKPEEKSATAPPAPPPEVTSSLPGNPEQKSAGAPAKLPVDQPAAQAAASKIKAAQPTFPPVTPLE